MGRYHIGAFVTNSVDPSEHHLIKICKDHSSFLNSPDSFLILESSGSIEDLCETFLPSIDSVPNHRRNSLGLIAIESNDILI